jgi:hypothetical protein
MRMFLLMALAISAMALAACGGSSDDPTAAPGAGTATVSGSATATSTRTATSTPGGLGDLFENACSALGLVTGLPGALLGTQASGEPTSDTSRDYSDFFAGVIGDALGDTTPECYFEINENDELLIYVAYSLDNTPPANAPDLIKQSLADTGVVESSIDTYSLASGGFGFAGVSAAGMDLLGDTVDAQMFLSGNTVVLTVTAGDSSGGDFDEPTPTVSSSGGPTSTPAAEPTIVASGLSAQLDAVLRAALQERLGVSLGLTSEFSSSSGGSSTSFMTYQATGSVSGNAGDAFSDLIEDFGGEVSLSTSGGGQTLVYFTGLQVIERSATGWLGYDGEIVSLTITFE